MYDCIPSIKENKNIKYNKINFSFIMARFNP